MLPTTRYNDFDDLLEFVLGFPSGKDAAFVDMVRKSPETITLIQDNLTTLKTLGRSAELSQKIEQCHIDALVNFVEPRYSDQVSLEGLSIIANALVINQLLLNQWDCTEIFNLTLDLYFYRANRLKLKERYLLRRLGFLFTYRQDRLSKDQVAIYYPLLKDSMSRLPFDIHTFSDASKMPLRKYSTIELLKIAFNVFHHYTDIILEPLENVGTMYQVCKALVLVDTTQLLDADVARYLFNCLMCSTHTESWYNVEGINEDKADDLDKLIQIVPSNDWSDTEKHLVSSSTLLIRFLDFAELATSPQSGDTLLSDINLSSCLNCLQRVIKLIYQPRWNAEGVQIPDTPKISKLKQIAEDYLLPTDQDRKYPLGSLDAPPSLCNSFVRFSSDISLVTCTTIVQDIYWKMSYEKENLLVSRMGLGFASGILSNANQLFSGSNNTSQPTESPNIQTQCQSDQTERIRTHQYQESSEAVSKSVSSTSLFGSVSSSLPTPSLSKLKSKTKAAKAKAIPIIKSISPSCSDVRDADKKEGPSSVESGSRLPFSKYFQSNSSNSSTNSMSPPSRSGSMDDDNSDMAGSDASLTRASSFGGTSTGSCTLNPIKNIARSSIFQKRLPNNIKRSPSSTSSTNDSVLSRASTSSSYITGQEDNTVASSNASTLISNNNSGTSLPPLAQSASGSLNPVTGQYMNYEDADKDANKVHRHATERQQHHFETPRSGANDGEWTEEEKEREAERMLELVERLNSGAINVSKREQ